MQPIRRSTPTISPVLRHSTLFALTVLIGLGAAGVMAKTTGDALSAILLVLVFLISAAAILAPREERHRHICG